MSEETGQFASRRAGEGETLSQSSAQSGAARRSKAARVGCGVGVTGGLVVVFVVIAWMSAGGWLQRVDEAVAGWVPWAYLGPLAFLLSLITWLGSWQFLVGAVVVAAVVLSRRGRWPWAAALGAATAGAGLADQLLKQLLARSRPPASLESVPGYSPYSFPSGHAMMAAAFYGMCAWLALRSRLGRGAKLLAVGGAVVAVLLVGGSRVYLGAHWLSDVLAGYAAGGAWLALCVTACVACER